MKHGTTWDDIGILIEKAKMDEDVVVEIIRKRIQERVKDNFLIDFKIDEFCEEARISEANIEKLLNQPELKSVYSDLKMIKDFSALPSRIQLHLCLVQLEKPNIKKEIPYILKTYEMNPIMAKNLIRGMQSADEESLENIHAIIGCIPVNYHELSDEQYRNIVQQKLVSYKRNGDILEDLKNKQINVDQWLNYDQKDSLILENPQENLVEFLYPQVNRLLRSAQHIKSVIMEKLNPYQSQFKKETIENPEYDIAEKN